MEYKVGDRIDYKSFSYSNYNKKFQLGYNLISALLGFYFEKGSGVIVDTKNVITSGVEVLAYIILTDDMEVFGISELMMDSVIERVNGKRKKIKSKHSE